MTNIEKQFQGFSKEDLLKEFFVNIGYVNYFIKEIQNRIRSEGKDKFYAEIRMGNLRDLHKSLKTVEEKIPAAIKFLPEEITLY